jgi:hypothetical protein
MTMSGPSPSRVAELAARYGSDEALGVEWDDEEREDWKDWEDWEDSTTCSAGAP